MYILMATLRQNLKVIAVMMNHPRDIECIAVSDDDNEPIGNPLDTDDPGLRAIFDAAPDAEVPEKKNDIATL